MYMELCQRGVTLAHIEYDRAMTTRQDVAVVKPVAATVATTVVPPNFSK